MILFAETTSTKYRVWQLPHEIQGNTRVDPELFPDKFVGWLAVTSAPIAD